MRVSEGAARRASERSPGTPGFRRLLWKAAEGRPQVWGARRGTGATLAARRAEAEREDLGHAERRDGFREEQRAAPAAPWQPPPPAGPAAPPAALRALARALPLAIDGSGPRDGATIALALGRSLAIELRLAPGGLELVLRADRRLAGACAEGLPALVAALGRRGIAVARAGIRPRSGAPGGARVDLPPPLR
jgi:hypothetical protein